MKKLSSALLFTTVALASAISLLAQPPATPPAAAPRAASTGGRSPHETTSAVIDGNRVILVYGRPFTKEPRTGAIRKIWGDLVPFGKVWRTGSDEATLLITQMPIEIGGGVVAPGAYTLFTLPNEDGTAKLMINKQIGQWGVPRPGQDPKEIYNEANDVVRADLKKESVDKNIDQFTMAVEKNPAGGGLIKLSWENTQYSAPFTVKKP